MRKGEMVPDFELPDETGSVRKLSTLLLGGPIVLFFYPAALTYGCTKEGCHFRDVGAEFAEIGAQRVGISADKVERQNIFATKYEFDFPLLSDPDYSIAEMLGARHLIRAMGNKRITYLIDTDRTLIDIINSEVSMHTHADRAIKILRARTATT